jgi:hypothetical protein
MRINPLLQKGGDTDAVTHHTINTSGGMAVQFHSFLTGRGYVYVSDEIHAPVTFRLEYIWEKRLGINHSWIKKGKGFSSNTYVIFDVLSVTTKIIIRNTV